MTTLVDTTTIEVDGRDYQCRVEVDPVVNRYYAFIDRRGVMMAIASSYEGVKSIAHNLIVEDLRLEREYNEKGENT